MKQNEKLKIILYFSLLLLLGLLAICWRHYLLLPPCVFMANWGVHGLGTMGITLILFLAAEWRGYNKGSINKAALVACVMSLVYVTLDEVLQQWQPGRVCDIYDIIANTIGVIFAYCAIQLLGSPFRM
jgi:VanZ family protein